MKKPETNHSKYIVIEGPIGVGKTSLARRLAVTFQGELLLEAPEENPFLESFYSENQSIAFPTQLFFLLQRLNQSTRIGEAGERATSLIGDFMFEKDRLFARLNLSEREVALYEEICSSLVVEWPKPDLIVYLQASSENLYQRVCKRNRKVEKNLAPGYLEHLSNCYTDFFDSYSRCSVLPVDTNGINPIDNEADYECLLKQICEVIECDCSSYLMSAAR